MVFSKLGSVLEKEWKFFFRRMRDDIAYTNYRLYKTCGSITIEAINQELLDSSAVQRMGEKW